MCPSARRSALSALMLAALCSFTSGAVAQAAGIVDGRGMRLSGSHTFVFTPSAAGGTVNWSLDRETISEGGTRTRTNGIASRTGSTATFSLTAVSGSETIYYITAADGGVQDVETVQVFTPNIRTWFTYRSAGNPDVRVYAVIPSTLSAATRVLLSMHGNSRTGSDFVDIWRSWATQHDYIVVTPHYDIENWPTTGMYQMGNVFTGDDCTGTLNPEERWTFTIDLGVHQRVRDGFGLADPRFDMWGFSGGGQHVHRFMLFKPDAPVRLAIAAGSGWYTAPDLGIDCPYGQDDAPLGFTHQQVLDWTNRNMIIMVGTSDTVRDEDLRTTARADAQGLNRYERAHYMWNKGFAFNPATRWRCIDVPNVAHEAKLMAQAAQGLVLESPVSAPEPPRPVARGPMLRVHPNPLQGSGSLSGEGWGHGEVNLELFDLAGRRVAAATAPVLDGQWRLAWSSLVGSARIAKGVYLVRTRDRERRAEQKVVVIE